MNLPSIFGRNETGGLRNSIAQMQREFDKFINNLSNADSRLFSDDFRLSCEMSEDDTNYFVSMDIPGVKKGDVKIEIDGDMLNVYAERKDEKSSGNKKNRYSEISYGSYQRSFTLPASVKADKIDAKFDNGVLTVTMPKSEPSHLKQIKVN